MPGHVVFLECYPHIRGGAQATTAALARNLPDHGWTAEVVAPADGPALDALRASGVRTTVLHAPSALLRYGGAHGARSRISAARALPAWSVRLARHLRRTGADLIDVVDQRGVVLGAPAARLAKVNGIWHVHSPGRPSAIDRYGLRWARECIVPSSAVAEQLSGRATVVAPALPFMRSMPRPSFDGDAPRIVAAGRLHPAKGFDVLIEAVGQLRRHIPELSLDIYGAAQEGHEDHLRTLEVRVAALGLQHVVRLAGHACCPWSQWDGAATFVQPSRREPFGMALIEAMACGFPVIATRVAGPSEIVDDGHTGLLVPPDDADALAAAIERVLRDHDLARAMAAAARAHVVETYTIERLLARTAAVFDRARRP